MAVDVSKASNVRAFTTGSVILAEGAATQKEMILLLQGNVGIYRNYGLNSQEQVGVIGQGSFHGELSLFLNQEHGETLVALTNVLVMEITRKNVRTFFASQPDMAMAIVEGICNKLNQANTALRKVQGSAAAQAPSRKSKLFPEQHGSYQLPLRNDSEYVYADHAECPLCKYKFDVLSVIHSKLRMDHTEEDLRAVYKDFEPMLYEIITCPNCFFSASVEEFPKVNRRFASKINQKVGPFKLEMYIRSGADRDSFTVFASYYLAILCAPVVFDDDQLMTAEYWLKLSRLYKDCDDEEMFRYASQQALKDYLYAYEYCSISESHVQQICYLIGELYLREGKLDSAREFFFQAKTHRLGTQVLKRQADMRLEDIRELKNTSRLQRVSTS